MKLLKKKQGKMTTSMINTAILVIILLVVLFQIYATLVPEAQEAGDSLNDSNRCTDVSCFYNGSRTTACTANNVTAGDTTACTNSGSIIPLGGLLGGQGFVFVIIMAALIILVVKSFMPKKK